MIDQFSYLKLVKITSYYHHWDETKFNFEVNLAYFVKNRFYNFIFHNLLLKNVGDKFTIFSTRSLNK